MVAEGARPPLSIWLLHSGEPLPLDDSGTRPFRMSMLASQLVADGHRVVWWTSSVNHVRKEQRVRQDSEFEFGSVNLRILWAPLYTRNVSLRRLASQTYFAFKFARAAQGMKPPDAVVCSLPTIESAVAAALYCRRRLPLIFDVRDVYPDTYMLVIPRWARRLAELCLAPYRMLAARALRSASSILATSDSYLGWALQLAHRPRSPNDRVFALGYPSGPQSSGEASDMERLAQSGVDFSKKICLFVGTFGRTYDLETVIAAAELCQGAGLDQVQFVLSGSGTQEADLRARSFGLKNVAFTGWLGSADIGVMMDNAWVGLCCYVGDAPQVLPNKIFEYMSAGLPMISSLRGEAEELLRSEGCALTYSAGAAADLVAKVRQLADTPGLYDAMKQACLTLFEARFSARRIYPSMVRHIEEVCATLGRG